MKVPLMNLCAQYEGLRKDIQKTVNDIMEKQAFVLGETVEKFENEIASYCRTKYAVGLNSGTDALFLSLKALNIGMQDEVVAPAFTFFATTEAISLTGAKPVFADIDPETYNICPKSLESRITKKTKAIIPVHLYGQCADMDPIANIAKKHGLKVIEDACQAIGATYKGKKAGSLSDAGCLSFFPSKNLGAFGDGGMLVTDNKELADRISILRVHGSEKRYMHQEIGINSRLDSIQAAVLRVKLKYLDGWLDKRRQKAEYYSKQFSSLSVSCPHVADHAVHTYHLYVLRVEKYSEKLLTFLNDNGIEARKYYSVPLHLQACYKSLGYEKGDLPATEKAAEESIAIPIFPEITTKEQDYVVSKVKEFFNTKKT